MLFARPAGMRLVCLLLLLAASAAGAQEASVRFLILDFDSDGYVSLAEAAGIEDVVLRFDRADRDRDGQLSSREFDRLERIRPRSVSMKRHQIRATVSRDARAVEREAALEAAAAEAASGASQQ
ncbi:MAG TPA: hypothetical protein VF211_04220 [Burkholderiales bacterium]